MDHSHFGYIFTWHITSIMSDITRPGAWSGIILFLHGLLSVIFTTLQLSWLLQTTVGASASLIWFLLAYCQYGLAAFKLNWTVSGGRVTSWDNVYCHSPGYLSGKTVSQVRKLLRTIIISMTIIIQIISYPGERGAVGVRQQGGGPGLQGQSRCQV